jgi:hypothetical protein
MQIIVCAEDTENLTANFTAIAPLLRTENVGSQTEMIRVPQMLREFPLLMTNLSVGAGKLSQYRG